jgi:hypothetical protein
MKDEVRRMKILSEVRRMEILSEVRRMEILSEVEGFIPHPSTFGMRRSTCRE